jgi:hypothetical protein
VLPTGADKDIRLRTVSKAYTAGKFTPMLKVWKPQKLPFLRISTVNELCTTDIECAVFSVRMNI